MPVLEEAARLGSDADKLCCTSASRAFGQGSYEGTTDVKEVGAHEEAGGLVHVIEGCAARIHEPRPQRTNWQSGSMALRARVWTTMMWSWRAYLQIRRLLQSWKGRKFQHPAVRLPSILEVHGCVPRTLQ